MPLNFLRKDSNQGMNILIVSAACCVPGLAPLDEQARRIIEQVLSETGVEAQVQVMPATNAFFGAVPKSIMAELMNRFQTGQMPVPAVLIDGKPVAFGVAELENFKPALLAAIAANPKITKQEKPNDQGHLGESPA